MNMNSKNRTFIAVIIVVILLVAFMIYRSKNGPLPVPAAETGASYSLADVAKHKEASSCWTAISGSVYDLTAWIDQHPGGSENILRTCGIDATAAFQAQHGGQGRPEAELASFKIGALAR